MTGPVPRVRVLPSIPGVWQGRRATQAPAVRTGIASLDAVLPGSGWPLGAVTELIPLAEGIGEMSVSGAVASGTLPEQRSWTAVIGCTFTMNILASLLLVSAIASEASCRPGKPTWPRLKP